MLYFFVFLKSQKKQPPKKTKNILKTPMQTTHYQFLTHRSTNIGGYRYFFNGQEADNEVFGETANFGYEFRQYDSRLARWWSVDPKWNEYPNVSPFVFCNGSPIMLMDPDGERVFAYNNDIKTRKYIKRYMKEQFGASNMIRFKGDGEMVLKKHNFEKILLKANTHQATLLQGLYDAITTPEKVLVKIEKDMSCVNFSKQSIIGYEDDGTPIMDEPRETPMETKNTGGGATVKSKFFNAYLIGISDRVANETKTSTGEYLIGGTSEDKLYPITTGNASSVFFHELLDEFLNYYVNRNVSNDSPGIEQVKFQNEALKNTHQPVRDGTDHER